jgi:hypothetical protein
MGTAAEPCGDNREYFVRMQLRTLICSVLAMSLLPALPTFAAEEPQLTNVALTSTAISPGLTAEEIVRRLDEHNAERAADLHSYYGARSYHLKYRGFFMKKEAEMEVIAHYQAPAEKSFEVVSGNGSEVLQTKVLKKLLESEEEAMTPEHQRETALTPENYTFTLLGSRPSPYGGCYRLRVEPRRDNKFLYRGEICVNAADFAVETIDAEPAKNPSFWISKTKIEHRYRKVGEFWLPASNKSVTSVRLGGKATLNIDYASYELR